MKRASGFMYLLGALIAAALACNLPSGAPTPTPTVDANATLASLALTQASGGEQQPPAQPEASPTAGGGAPAPTPTWTPSVPMVSVSLDTNCRTGPGVAYPYLTALLVGEKAEVVGKYTSLTPVYWIIKKGSITCWLWGQYATVEGNTSNLPEMVPPPSPTPPPPTATPTTPPPAGDMYIVDIFMSTQFEVIARVGVLPTGSLSGDHQYTVYSGGAQVAQGMCDIPTGENACWTGYKVTGVEAIQVVIDSNNAIPESNEANNTSSVTCDKFGFDCN